MFAGKVMFLERNVPWSAKTARLLTDVLAANGKLYVSPDGIYFKIVCNYERWDVPEISKSVESSMAACMDKCSSTLGCKRYAFFLCIGYMYASVLTPRVAFATSHGQSTRPLTLPRGTAVYSKWVKMSHQLSAARVSTLVRS